MSRKSRGKPTPHQRTMGWMFLTGLGLVALVLVWLMSRAAY